MRGQRKCSNSVCNITFNENIQTQKDDLFGFVIVSLIDFTTPCTVPVIVS